MLISDVAGCTVSFTKNSCPCNRAGVHIVNRYIRCSVEGVVGGEGPGEAGLNVRKVIKAVGILL